MDGVSCREYCYVRIVLGSRVSPGTWVNVAGPDVNWTAEGDGEPTTKPRRFPAEWVTKVDNIQNRWRRREASEYRYAFVLRIRTRLMQPVSRRPGLLSTKSSSSSVMFIVIGGGLYLVVGGQLLWREEMSAHSG
jgi:hypothetical protein